MSGSIYIKCNKCGNQQKLPFSSMGKVVCKCGANDYLMSANSKADNKPDWWIEGKRQDTDDEKSDEDAKLSELVARAKELGILMC